MLETSILFFIQDHFLPYKRQKKIFHPVVLDIYVVLRVTTLNISG